MSAARARAGFTLAEVAVTLLIVGIGLTLVVQGLMNAKFQAADTNYRKLSRELALVTLGQLESGLFWEELDAGEGDVLSGTYAEDGHEEVSYEVVLGGEEFTDESSRYDDRNAAYHDSWEYERERQDRLKDKDDDDEDEDQVAEPFEKVRIRVTYPKFGERENTFVLERWIPWEQVYGSEEGEQPAAAAGEGEQQP